MKHLLCYVLGHRRKRVILQSVLNNGIGYIKPYGVCERCGERLEADGREKNVEIRSDQ